MCKTRFCAVLLMIAILMVGCQTITNFVKPVSEKTTSSFTPIDPQTLDSSARLALTTIDLARLGMLESFPYVRKGPDSRFHLNNRTDYNQFRPENLLILENKTEDDGLRTLAILGRSVDATGRFDLSYDHILYTPVIPNTAEKKAIAKSLSEGRRLTKASKNKKTKANFKASAAEYQKASGLTPDGIVGKKTIATMVNDVRILDVEKLSTEIVYPPQPLNEIYILPQETVDADPDQFTNGFESLPAVQAKAIALEDFKNIVRKQKNFVFFTYFYDRVDPGSAIQIGFSKYEKGRSQSKSPELYNTPENWPVVVWPIDIQRIDSFGNLYVNVYIDGKAVQGYRLR